MRRNKTKVGGLMSTQTGGTGETIQSQQEIINTPEELTKEIQPINTEVEPVNAEDIKPVVAAEGEPDKSIQTQASPQAAGPIEQPIVDSEQPIQPIGVTGPTIVNQPQEIVSPTEQPILENNFYDPTDVFNEDGTREDILAPSYETTVGTLAVPNLSPNVEPLIRAEEDDSEPIFFSQEEKDNYETQKERSQYEPEVLSYFDEVEKKELDKENQMKTANAILSEKKPITTSYGNIAKQIKSPTYTGKDYEDVYDQPKYGPSSNQQNFMDLFGLDEIEIGQISLDISQSQGAEALYEYSRLTNGYVQAKDNIDKTTNSLNDKSLDESQREILKKQLKEYSNYAEDLKAQIDEFDFSDKKYYKPQDGTKEVDVETSEDLYSKFENTTKWKLKKIYTTKWEEKKFYDQFSGEYKYSLYEIPLAKLYETYKTPSSLGKISMMTAKEAQEFKRYAMWLDTEGRRLIKNDVKNGTTTYLTKESEKWGDIGGFQYELRNNIYESEAHNLYQQTGKIDNFTYTGFKATANRLAKENNKKINDAIKGVATNIVTSAKNQEEEWVAQNKPILMKQVNEAKVKMDALLKDKIQNALIDNQDASAVYADYSEKIQLAQTKEDQAKLSKEMMDALKKFPTITKVFNEYQTALTDFTNEAQAEYTAKYAGFKAKIFDMATLDMQDGIKTAIKDVYRSNINNDINTYEYANKIVNSDEFKAASFYGKRKILSDAWELEKNRITFMVKSGIMKFPQSNAEAGKHWQEWTGARAMTAEEKKKWTSELAKRTGNDARSRFIFYAVDDLLYSPKGKPTIYGIQAFAREQLNELDAKKKALGIKDYQDAIYGNNRAKKYALSVEEAKQMMLTENYLTKILNTPETDSGFWSEVSSGFVDNFQIPFLSSLVNIGNTKTLTGAVDRYRRGGMDLFDLSLVDAYAALNKLSEIKPRSIGYNIGSGLSYTLGFMGEMALTGGLNAIGKTGAQALTGMVLNTAKNAADDVVRASVTAAAEVPSYVNNIQKVVGFIGGATVEGTIGSTRGYEAYLQRMVDEVSVQESGAYDGLIAVVDRNSGEDSFEAFFKAYGNQIGMMGLERLGAHMPFGKMTNDALAHMGTSTFLKRTAIGKIMRDYGFKTIDEATEYLATTKMPWSGFLPELVEEILQGGWEAVITGDKPLFGIDENTGEMNYMGMTKDEYKTTIGVVGLFGFGASVARNVKTKIKKSSDSDEKTVSIQLTNQDGTESSVDMDYETWNKYNSMMSDPNLTWKSVSIMMENDDNLTPHQQLAIANILIKTRGKEILEEEGYKEWKEENSTTVQTLDDFEKAIAERKKKAYDALTDEQKKKLEESNAAANYQYLSVGGILSAEDFARTAAKGGAYEAFVTLSQNEELLTDGNYVVESDDQIESKTKDETVAQAETLAEDKKKRKKKSKNLTPTSRRRTPSKPKEQEGIEFEMPKAEVEVTEEAPVTESTITTPIDLTNDQENITGVSGQVAEGAQPIETQPIAETGQETPGTSGVVQETGQEVAIGETVEVNGEKYTKVETAVVGEPKGTAYRGEDGMSYKTEWVESNMTPKEAAPVEQKSLEKIVQDTQDNETRRIENLSVEEYINEDFPLLSYEGQDELTRNQVNAYNKKSRKVNENGSFSDKYAESIIQYLATILPDRKLISAFRRAGLDVPRSYDISADYRRMGVNGYIRENIGLIANGYYILSESEKIEATKILSKAAKDTGIKVATLESEANREVIKPSVETVPAKATTEAAPTETVEITPEAVPTETVEITPEAAPTETVEITPLEAVREVVNEIYENGEEQERAAELAVFEERLNELEKEKASTPEETEVEEEEVVSPEVQRAREGFVGIYTNPSNKASQKKRLLEYISNKQSSLDPNEREGARLALQDIESLKKEESQKKATARGKKEKTDSDGFVSVESRSMGRINKGEYDENGKLKTGRGFHSVKYSEDGSRVDVKDNTGKVVLKGEKVQENENGTKYITAPGGVTLLLDRPVMNKIDVAPKVETKEEETKPEYKKRITLFYEPGKKTPNVGMTARELSNLERELESLQSDPEFKNDKAKKDRAKEIEDTLQANEGKVTPKAAELEQKLQYDPKSKSFSGSPVDAGITGRREIVDSYTKGEITEDEFKLLDNFLEDKKNAYYANKNKTEQDKKAESTSKKAKEIIDSNMNNPEATEEDKEELAQDEAKIAAEVIASDTKKPRGKRATRPSKAATVARGSITTLTETLLSRLINAFPNFINAVDTRQSEFQRAAAQTGRPSSTAAIILDGVVYLNDRVANENTALEEFSHIYLLVMQANNIALYNKGIRTVQTQAPEYIDEVISDPGYADIHGNKPFDELTQTQKDAVAFEALSKMIADRGEAILDEKRKSPIITFIKDFWRNLGRLIYGFSRKIDPMRDDISTYTDLIARELLKGRPISSITPDKLREIMDVNANGGQIGYVPLASTSLMNFKSDWIGSARRFFAANKGVGEDLAMKLKQPNRRIKEAQNQVRLALKDFNKGLNKYLKATKADKIDILTKIDEVLKDPVERANWFATDALANQHLSLPIYTMRSMIDSLSMELANSGRFGETLNLAINSNLDAYVHTSYFVYSKAAEVARENWLEYYDDADRQEILDWIYDGAYSKATSMNYSVDSNGEVTISFNNSVGKTTSEIKLANKDAVKQFLKDNVRTVVGYKPARVKVSDMSKTKGEIALGSAMNIDKTNLKYVATDADLTSYVGEMLASDGKQQLTDFLNLQKQITSSGEKSITKKKAKRMNEAQRKFLKEIKDPIFNFSNTVVKQAGLLYKSEIEQQILDSGFLALGTNPQGDKGKGWTKITNVNSLLYGKYVPVEMYDMLMGTDLIPTKDGNVVYKFLAGASAFTKMALTVLSPGSNAANYVSGWTQLLKTGAITPRLSGIGHRAAMRAVEQEMNLSAEVVSVPLNLLATAVRHASKVFGESKRIKNMGLQLNPLQEARYGTSNFDLLTSKQKAQVFADELMEMGILGGSIEAESLIQLAEFAFDNIDIPENVLREANTRATRARRVTSRIGRGIKRGAAKLSKASGDAYSFSDSMFKAMMYMDHKDFNMKTYGAEMLKNGMSQQEVEEAIKLKTAQQVRSQMPTYDRSPEFLRFISKLPFIGPFVQFDFQNKVNDKNILLDGAKMMFVDAPRMMKNGMTSESSKVFMKGAYKSGAALFSQYMFTILYGLMSNGWDDDDDQAFRTVQANYRRFNPIIHLDKNKKGLHSYVDLNRVMPQAMYLKFWRAYKEEGVNEALSQFFEPYLKQDVFSGALIDTFSGINKYGAQDATLANMSNLEKLEYALTERLLPSTAVGQAKKVINAIKGEESMEGVDASATNEVMNVLFGVKIRTTNIGKDFGSKVTYGDYKKIEVNKAKLNEAIEARDSRIEQQGRGVEAATDEDIKRLEENVAVEYEKFTSDVNERISSLQLLASKFVKMGHTEQELYNYMVDRGTPQWMASAVVYGTPVNYSEVTGKRIEIKQETKDDLDLDLNLDLDLDLDLDFGPK